MAWPLVQRRVIQGTEVLGLECGYLAFQPGSLSRACRGRLSSGLLAGIPLLFFRLPRGASLANQAFSLPSAGVPHLGYTETVA